MKTERFEDQIRKKLESIQPEFQEKDWANFKAYSGAAKSPFLKNLFSKTIFNAAASVAAASIIFFAGNQYFVNKSLENKIALLEKTIENRQQTISNSRQIGNSAIVNSNEQLAESNTLEENALNPIEDKRNESENFAATKQKSIPVSENNELVSPNLKDNFSANNKSFENKNRLGNSLNNVRQFAARRAGKISFREHYLPDNKKTGFNNNDLTVNKNGLNIIIDNKINHDLSEISSENTANLNSNKLSFSYLQNKGISIDSTRKLKREFNKKDFAYYDEDLIVKKKLSFTLADAYLRTGMVSSISSGKIGYGVNAELFMDQRLSLSVGGRISKLKGNQFPTDQHFFKVNNQNLIDKYHIENPRFKKILNIKEEINLVSIPIRFNYNHPLANGLKLIASVGSDLDLKVKKTVDFEDDRSGFFVVNQNPPRPNFEKNEFVASIENKLLNNMAIGIGAEKRFGKFGAQIKLNDTVRLKNVSYRISKNQIGGEFGIYYQL